MKKTLLGLTVVILILSLCFSDVPKTVNYQGKLFESGGPVNDTRAIGYRIYKDINDNHKWDDGTDSLVWEQIPADVTVSDGLFSDTLDFSAGYQGSYDFASVFGSGADLFLRVYVGPSGSYSDFTGTTPLDPPEVFRSAPYAFYAQNAVSISNLEDGTSANQTLRWDGSKWVASDALQNDGTDVTVTGDLRVSGNNIYGQSGGSSFLFIHSDHGVMVDLDDDDNVSSTFFAIRNGDNDTVFKVTEGGNVSAEGNATFDGNLTLSGDDRYISSGDALDIRGNSGIDVYIDYDESGTGSEFYVKTVSGGSDVNLFRVDEDGDARVYRKLNLTPQSSAPAGVSGDLYVKSASGVADTLYFHDGSDWRPVVVGNAATSLQGAYEGGNAINVSSTHGSVQINNSDATTPLVVMSSAAGNEAAYFANTSSGNAIKTGGGSNSGNIWMETGNLTVDNGNVTIDGNLTVRDNSGPTNKFTVTGSSGNLWTAGNIYLENNATIYAKNSSGSDVAVFVPMKSETTLINLPGNDLKFRDSGGNMVMQLTGGTDQLIWAWGSVVDADSATNNLGSNANPFANLYLDNQIVWEKGSNDGILQVASLTDTRTWTLPDATGTIALAENTDNYQYWTASDGSNSSNINSHSTLTFTGSGGIDVSLSGNTITIDGSGIGGGQWTDAGEYLYPSDDGNELTKVYETSLPTYRVFGRTQQSDDYAFGALGYYGTAIGGTSRHIGVYGNSGSGTDNVAVAGRYSAGRYGYIGGERYEVYGKFDEDATGLASTMAGYFVNDNDENNSSYSKFGVYGDVTGDYGTKYAIYGSSQGAGTNYGVYGKATVSGDNNYGVYGEAANGTSNNYGGYFTGTNYGVYGQSSNWAGYFDGNVGINGNLDLSQGTVILDSDGDAPSAAGDVLVYDGTDYNWQAVSGGGSSGNFGINVETLTGDKTLQVGTDEMYQYLDPNGADRDITLSTSGASAGDRFVIRNNGSYNSSYALIVKQGGTQLDWIYAGGIKEFIFDGTNWVSASNGTGENDDKKYNVSLGYGTKAYEHGIAIGYGAQGYTYGTGVGEYADGHNHGAALGRYADADAYGVAMGDHADGHSSGVAIGYYAGSSITSGSGNILIGYQAGDNITTGTNNILIGYNIDTPDATTSNFLSIGNLIFATGIDGEGTTVSSGNVGIGEPNPSHKLVVAGDAGFNDYLYHNGDENTYIYFTPDRIQFYTGGRNMIDVQYSDDEVAINEGGTQTDFRVEGGSDDHLLFTDGSTDRVGIGTSSPAAKLDVNGTVRAAHYRDSGGGNLIRSSDGSINVSEDSDGSWNITVSGGGGGTPGGSDGQIQYNNGGVFGGAAEFYYDDVNKRVGIGTSSPDGKLHIASSSGDARVYIERPSTSDEASIRFQTAGSNDWFLGLDDPASGYNNFQLYNYDAGEYVVTVENNTGNVGIGTSSPETDLHIQATSGAGEGVIIDGDTYGCPVIILRNTNTYGSMVYGFGRSGGTYYAGIELEIDSSGTEVNKMVLYNNNPGAIEFEIKPSSSGVQTLMRMPPDASRVSMLKPLSLDYSRTYVTAYDGSSNHWVTTGGSEPGSCLMSFIGTGSGSATAVNIAPGGGTGLYVNTSKNVGVGTSSPGTNRLYVSGSFAASGTKSAVVRTEEGPKALYCQESPEVWFEDFGSGKIVDGKAVVKLKRDFLQTVTINEKYPMKVFIQMSDTRVKYKLTKGFDYFTIEVVEGPTDDVEFDYRVVAKRKGYEDRRLDPVPSAYTDHFLYPDINDVPQEYRLEWVKQIPPEMRDPELLKALTPEQIKKLGKDPIRTEPKQEILQTSTKLKSAPSKPENAKKTTPKIDKLNLEKQMRKAKVNTGAIGKSNAAAPEPNEAPEEE